MPNNHFDYIIIGNGLAGLQLALALEDDSFFKNKDIALIDPNKKQTNDKTWSFWETFAGKFDVLAKKTWTKAQFFSSQTHLNLNLSPYTYKSIDALDFYNFAINRLKKKSNFHFILDEVISVETNTASVFTKTETYTATHIFDSRIPEAFYTEKKHISIIQHFKGWVIKTEEKTFNPETFTMMDYRLKDGNQTTFTYVLPFSETEALVEFTYFTAQTVDEQVYDTYIKTYISEYLNIENCTILETETGQIPMTTFPFESYNSKNLTKIGTAGGWIKASTGYSFKHSEKKVAIILNNLKNNQLPSKNLFKRKYKFYDKIFLKVLLDENHKGEWLFTNYYKKNSVETMLRFLDEDSSFLEDLKIMSSLFSWRFIKAFFKTL